MIPKEVTDALDDLHNVSVVAYHNTRNSKMHEAHKIIKNFLETTDRYVHDLEQHVDDLSASYGGTSD